MFALKIIFKRNIFTRLNCISHRCQHPIHQFSEVFLDSGATYTYCIKRDEEAFVDSDEKIHENLGCQQENAKGASEDRCEEKNNKFADESLVVHAKSERGLKKLSTYQEKRQWAKMKKFFTGLNCYL